MFQLLNCCVNLSPAGWGEEEAGGWGRVERVLERGGRGGWRGQRTALCSAPQLIPIWRNSPNVGDRLALLRGLVK